MQNLNFRKRSRKIHNDFLNLYQNTSTEVEIKHLCEELSQFLLEEANYQIFDFEKERLVTCMFKCRSRIHKPNKAYAYLTVVGKHWLITHKKALRSPQSWASVFRKHMLVWQQMQKHGVRLSI